MAGTTTIHVDHYFTCMDHLKQRFDRLARQMGFRATKPDEVAAWQRELRAQVRQLLGLDTMLACLPNARTTERVGCAVTSGYFYGAKDSLLVLSGNCACNYVPGLWKIADMGDLGALIAPRPLCIETGTEDSLNGERGVANVTEQVDITRAAYEVLGVGDRLLHHVFEGGHRWNGEKAIPWLKKWLGG